MPSYVLKTIISPYHTRGTVTVTLAAISLVSGQHRSTSSRVSIAKKMSTATGSASVMDAHAQDKINLESIKKAAERIKGHVHNTPMLTCSYLDSLVGDGKELFFKCENFQKTGSFKMRGTVNTIARIIEERGDKNFNVITHSSGNAAQALALAATRMNVKSKVVMPLNAPETKRKATLGYGAEIHRCESTARAREEMCERLRKEDPMNTEYVPSADHPFMMEGQGTIGLEMIEQVDGLDAVIVACSVGGLLSGIATACKEMKPNMKVFACEPQAADDLAQSFEKGERVGLDVYPVTIADGLRMNVGVHTWPVIKENVESVILVSEEEIISAMHLMWERMKIVVEPSGAVVLAAALTDKFKRESKGLKKIGLVVCGGNTDFLPSVKRP